MTLACPGCCRRAGFSPAAAAAFSSPPPPFLRSPRCLPGISNEIRRHNGRPNRRFAPLEQHCHREPPIDEVVQRDTVRPPTSPDEELPSSIRDRRRRGSEGDDDDGWPSLHVIRRLAEDLARSIVDHRPQDLRKRDPSGRLPLQVAIDCGAPAEVVRLLVDAHPEDLLDNTHGRHPLHEAVKRSGIGRNIGGGGGASSLEVIQLLVDRGPHVLLAIDEMGWVPLQAAIHCAAPAAVVQILIDARPQALLERNGNGYTPAHAAARLDSYADVVRCLVQACPDALWERSHDGELPLHVAVRYGSRLDAVQCLARGCPRALLAAETGTGYLPVHCAARYGRVPAGRYLATACPEALEVTDRGGCLPVHVAAHHGPPEMVQILADLCPRGLLVAREGDGWLPLHVAAQQSASIESVRGLVDGCPGAVHVVDKWGRLPLHVAAGSDRATLDPVRLVADAYPEALSTRCGGGWLPLHLAAACRGGADPSVIRFLASMGPPTALLDKANYQGLTPLHLAVRSGSQVEVIRCLVEAAPQGLAERGTNDGRLPLHVAAQRAAPSWSSPLEVIQYLVEEHPDALATKDDGGCLPAHVAAELGSMEVVTCLVGRRPQVLRERTNDGFLPLHIAAIHAPLDVVFYLVTMCPMSLE
jgi:ankyrin repeat protein